MCNLILEKFCQNVSPYLNILATKSATQEQSIANECVKSNQIQLKVRYFNTHFFLLFSFLFPDKFEFTPYIILSMGCLLTGIYLYETQKAANNVTNNSVTTAPVLTKVAGAKTATKTKNVENSKK